MKRHALAVVALGLVAACGSGAPDADVVGRHVPSQSADEVVQDYLDAVQDGDSATAAVLSTPGFAEQDSWQHGDAPGLSDVEVSDVVGDYPIPDPANVSEELRGHAQVVGVGVTFTVEDDGHGFSTDGPSGWGYVLVRDADTDPWLIAEAGNG